MCVTTRHLCLPGYQVTLFDLFITCYYQAPSYVYGNSYGHLHVQFGEAAPATCLKHTKCAAACTCVLAGNHHHSCHGSRAVFSRAFQTTSHDSLLRLVQTKCYKEQLV